MNMPRLLSSLMVHTAKSDLDRYAELCSGKTRRRQQRLGVRAETPSQARCKADEQATQPGLELPKGVTGRCCAPVVVGGSNSPGVPAKWQQLMTTTSHV